MDRLVLGRTNAEFGAVWLRLLPPHDRSHTQSLVDAALGADTVLDVSSQPALWGRYLSSEAVALAACGGQDIEHATDASHASGLIEAHLLQTLCALGRDRVDVYFLTVRRALEEAQIEGALTALEAARQEGHVGFVGLAVRGPASAVRATWQFHDGFDLVHFDRRETADELSSIAAEKRVGIVSSVAIDAPHARLFGVASATEVDSATHGMVLK